jgi:L-fuconate dehydratase
MKITGLEIVDLRFPTSLTQDGTDAVHKDPDYSAAYVILHTDGGHEGHGFTFTIGRGNEVCAEAIRAFTPLVVGRDVDEIFAAPAAFWRSLAGDSQLRWLGPEKGVIHISMAAIVNAMWDLHAKQAGQPLWKLLADMTPRQIVASIDFQYITDALTEDEALAILERQHSTKRDREPILRRDGYPAYTTSAGWMGYSDDKVRLLCREAVADGFTHFKVKVGADPADDARRVGMVRQEIGPGRHLMIDANQRWGVDEAIARVRALSQFNLLWIEEPTSPDDVLGHAAIARAVAPIGVATGEHCANRVLSSSCSSEGDRLLSDRQPSRRRQREPADPDGGEIRRAGLSARGGVGSAVGSICRCGLPGRLGRMDDRHRVRRSFHEHFVDRSWSGVDATWSHGGGHSSAIARVPGVGIVIRRPGGPNFAQEGSHA